MCLLSHCLKQCVHLVFTLSLLAVLVLTLRVGLHAPAGEEVAHGIVPNIVGNCTKPKKVSREEEEGGEGGKGGRRGKEGREDS